MAPIYTLFKAIKDFHTSQGTSHFQDSTLLRKLINERKHIRGSDTISILVDKLPMLRGMYPGPDYQALFDNIAKITAPPQESCYAKVVRNLLEQASLDLAKINVAIAGNRPIGVKEMDAIIKVYLAVNDAALMISS